MNSVVKENNEILENAKDDMKLLKELTTLEPIFAISFLFTSTFAKMLLMVKPMLMMIMGTMTFEIGSYAPLLYT